MDMVGRHVLLPACCLLAAATAFAVKATSGATEGTITKIDRTAKTVVIKAADGTEHTLRLAGGTVVHGGKEAYKGADAAAGDLREGSEVVVHYTKKGSEETADEIDHVGKDGLKVAQGTVSHVDQTARTVTVKTADGTEDTVRLSDRAFREAGKDAQDAAKKSGKVTVYYTEEAGRKVGHFYKAVF